VKTGEREINVIFKETLCFLRRRAERRMLNFPLAFRLWPLSDSHDSRFLNCFVRIVKRMVLATRRGSERIGRRGCFPLLEAS
jgi:hypothetical protein